MKSKTRKAAGKASLDPLVGGDWAYPTVQDWERCAGYKASRAFRAGFRCARDEHEHEAWQTGYDMARMTNALIRALANQVLTS
jgi:hypothetical protein